MKRFFADFVSGKPLFNKTNSFLYGAYYPVAVFAWVFLCFALRLQTVGLFAMILFACFVVLKAEDITPIAVLFLSFLFLITDYSLIPTMPYNIAYAVFILCLIIHYVFRHKKRIVLGRLFLPICLVSASLFLSGVFSPFINVQFGLTYAFAVGPLVLIIYLVFLNGIRPPAGFNVKKYFCYVFILCAALPCLELMLAKSFPDYFLSSPYKDIGWGNNNTIGALTLTAVPCCFYLLVKTGKSFICLSVAMFFVASAYITGSDGCLGIICLLFPFLCVLAFRQLDKKYRKEYMLCVFSLFMLALIFAVTVFAVYSIEEITEEIKKRANDSGRIQLYLHAWELYKGYPIFGVGQAYTNDTVFVGKGLEFLSGFNFHSVVFHVLATLGTFGAIAYTVYYVQRIRIIFEKFSNFNLFAGASFLGFFSYAVIDVSEFNVIPLLAVLTVLFAVTEICNAKKAEDVLPLFSF